MSWSDFPAGLSPATRRGFLRAAALTGAGLLAACGFRPLYGQSSTTAGSTTSAGGTVDAHLAAIRVKAPVWERSASPYDAAGSAKYDARTAQVLHNALRNALNPYGQPGNPAYELSMELSEKSNATLASDNGDIDRHDLVLKSHFRLGDIEGRELLLQDLWVTSSYATVREPYLDIVSRNDARERAAKQMAEMLKLRLSAYFTGHA